MISEDHDKDSKQDHVISRKQDQITSKDDNDEQSNTDDRVMPDVSTNTVYYETKSLASLHSNNDDVTDGGNGYDVQKELDEILSNSELVDGTHLNLSTQIIRTTATARATTTAATVASTRTTSTGTGVVAMDTSDVVDTKTSAVVKETSTSHTQSSSSTYHKSDNVALPSHSPMSDSVSCLVKS